MHALGDVDILVDRLNPGLIQRGLLEVGLSRGDLSEAEWRVLRELLPLEPGKRGPGRPPFNNREVINGILWRLRAGAPWRDLSERYGNWNSVYRRFWRWSASGVWEAVSTGLADVMGDAAHHSIDSTTADRRSYGMLMALAERRPKALLADKGYDADAIRSDLASRRVKAVIPGGPTASSPSSTTASSTSSATRSSA